MLPRSTLTTAGLRMTSGSMPVPASLRAMIAWAWGEIAHRLGRHRARSLLLSQCRGALSLGRAESSECVGKCSESPSELGYTGLPSSVGH